MHRTILSYPLSPFFVLFCNVVGTSDAHDFQLLTHVVDSVSSLAIENKQVERLRRLCNALLALCRPLVQNTFYPAVAPEQQPITLEEQHPDAVSNPIVVDDNNAVGEGGASVGDQAWGDGMMWQLFQAQPTLEWFNSEILDPDMWDLNLPG